MAPHLVGTGWSRHVEAETPDRTFGDSTNLLDLVVAVMKLEVPPHSLICCRKAARIY